MGRRRNSSTKSTQRDTSDIATDSEVLRNFITTPKPYTPVVTPKLHLPTFDQRRFHPDPITRPIAEPRKAARLVISEPARAVRPREAVQASSANRRIGSLPAKIAFSAPAQVSVCVRRKARREVLFAQQRTRKGAGSRRNRTQWSDIKC